MMHRVLFCLLALVAGLHALPAAAEVPSDDWQAFLDRMADVDAIVRLERQLAGYILIGEPENLASFAAEVTSDLGDFATFVGSGDWAGSFSSTDGFEHLITHALATELFRGIGQAREAINRIGACDSAGLLLRHIAMGIGEGRIATDLPEGRRLEVTPGRIVILAPELAAAYDISMQRCDIIRRSSTPRWLHAQ